MKKYYIRIAAMLAILAGICACGHREEPENPDTPDEKPYEEVDRKIAVNTFAYNVMGVYYLWKDEIADGLTVWQLNEDPIDKVNRVRYKDKSGKDIDKWTVLTENIDDMKKSTQGVNTTYGFDFKLYYTDSSQSGVCIVVTLVYPDSPAEKAGFKRGDVFMKIGGKTMTPDNYSKLLYDEFLYAPKCTLTDEEGNELDTCTIDPTTGIGTDTEGEEVNLPQTGNNAPEAASTAAAAVMMVIAGAFAAVRSGFLRKKHRKNIIC